MPKLRCVVAGGIGWLALIGTLMEVSLAGIASHIPWGAMLNLSDTAAANEAPLPLLCNRGVLKGEDLFDCMRTERAWLFRTGALFLFLQIGTMVRSGSNPWSDPARSNPEFRRSSQGKPPRVASRSAITAKLRWPMSTLGSEIAPSVDALGRLHWSGRGVIATSSQGLKNSPELGLQNSRSRAAR